MRTLVRPVVVLSLLIGHGPLGLAQETIRLRLVNTYAAQINLGIAKAERTLGADTVEGTIARQPDGSWKGEVQAKVSFTQEMKGLLGASCPKQEFQGSQRLNMSARAVSGFNPKVQTIAYRSGRAADFLLLAVRPVAKADMTKGDVACLSMYEYGDNTFPLLPLNDSRWLPEAGYTIGLPGRGVLEYTDDAVNTTAGGAALPVTAMGRWMVRVDRP